VTRNVQDKRSHLVRCPRVSGQLKLGHLPPAKAGDLAFRIFCTPEQSQYRTSDHHHLTQRARYHLRNANWQKVATPAGVVQCYVFDPDEDARGTVVLVHGWTSEAAFMTAFIEPLRRAGIRVLLFDFPAHGASPGRRTNLAECARAMLSVCDAYGPIDAAVAHSFGGFVALLVAEGGPPLPHAHPISRFVLIGCPNRLSDVTGHFGGQLGLTPAAQRAYEHHLERVGHRPVSTFSAVELLQTVKAPTLVIHGSCDREVPFHNAEAIAKLGAHVELQEYEGFGHRTILYAPQVMRAVMTYLAAHRDRAAPHRHASHHSADLL
jgi:pimeloyl-ACP methyl ester carboxylesterase